jgi:hypothetical protein
MYSKTPDQHRPNERNADHNNCNDSSLAQPSTWKVGCVKAKPHVSRIQGNLHGRIRGMVKRSAPKSAG